MLYDNTLPVYIIYEPALVKIVKIHNNAISKDFPIYPNLAWEKSSGMCEIGIPCKVVLVA